MKERFLFVTLLVTFVVFCPAAQPEARAQKRIAPYSQTPETLCCCASQVSKGGLRTFEEFIAKWGKSFKSPAEARLTWRVYQKASQRRHLAFEQTDRVPVIAQEIEVKAGKIRSY